MIWFILYILVGLFTSFISGITNFKFSGDIDEDAQLGMNMIFWPITLLIYLALGARELGELVKVVVTKKIKDLK